MTPARDAVRRMVGILGWDEYHTGRHLTLAILLEASELLQILQWKERAEVDQLFENIELHPEFSDEIADITINLLSLSDRLSLDLNQLTVDKCRTITDRFQRREGVSRGESRNTLQCHTCGQLVKAQWRHCASCGSPLMRGDKKLA
jgi:NTP pyrophosphatase (non-canonical NTP hydrolase)